VVPTLHIFAQRLGLTYFTTPSRGAFDDMSGYTEAERERMVRGYRILAGYVKRMYDAGVRLAVGTDWPDPGKAVLSEMLLLHEVGIPMPDVMAIASIGGARAIGREDLYGSVETGKRANFIVFEESPLDDPRALLGSRLVVKDGVLLSMEH
jgi:imidazolonepropionase-like amidohydrolase